MLEAFERQVSNKIKLLNRQKVAVIFIVTGGNGTGKSVMTKRLISGLPFHQSFNLGAVTKTIRYLNKSLVVSRLENFEDSKIQNLFTPIVQSACVEYQNNGVNVIIDGVQIDTKSKKWSSLATGGVVLSVEGTLKAKRNNYPDTHFKRKLDIRISDNHTYHPSDFFVTIDNNFSFSSSYVTVLEVLDNALDIQIDKLKQLGDCVNEQAPIAT